MHQPLDIRCGPAPSGQQGWECLQVGDRFQVVRTLLFPECTVEIGPDAYMNRITRYLADMIEVIGKFTQVASHRTWIRPAPLPARNHHPGIQRSPDHGSFRYQRTDHVVAELPVVIHE